MKHHNCSVRWWLNLDQEMNDCGRQARDILDELLTEKASRLADHLLRFGRLGRVADTRELVVHKNYVLIYDLAGDLVRVLRVLHAARQWPPVR